MALSREVLNTARKESRDISYIELMVDRPASEKYRIEPGGERWRGKRRTV